MATSLGRMVTYLEVLQTIKSNNAFNHVVLQGYVTNENHYISTARVPLATKLGRMVTYNDGLVHLKLHDPLITWFCEIM